MAQFYVAANYSEKSTFLDVIFKSPKGLQQKLRFKEEEKADNLYVEQEEDDYEFAHEDEYDFDLILKV